LICRNVFVTVQAVAKLSLPVPDLYIAVGILAITLVRETHQVSGIYCIYTFVKVHIKTIAPANLLIDHGYEFIVPTVRIVVLPGILHYKSILGNILEGKKTYATWHKKRWCSENPDKPVPP